MATNGILLKFTKRNLLELGQLFQFIQGTIVLAFGAFIVFLLVSCFIAAFYLIDLATNYLVR